jgi:hypothetical protein
MFCPYCGTKSKASGALFCGKCGKPLNAAIEGPDAMVGALADAGEVRRGVAWLAWPFWLLLICAAGSVSGYLIFLLNGHKPMAQSISSTLVWTGALMAYVWKKQGRSGWIGFGLGLLIAMSFFTVANFSVAIWREHQGQGPVVDSVRPFVDPDTLPNQGRTNPNPFDEFDPPASAVRR